MGPVRLSLTQSANWVGLTPPIVGFALSRQLGLGTALCTIAVACGITAALGSLSAAMAVSYRQPTAALSRHAFGAAGPRLVGAALGVALCGWFGLHAMALQQALQVLAPAAGAQPQALWLLPAAALSLWVVRTGNQRIAGINAVQAPLLMALLAWAARDGWAAVAALPGLAAPEPHAVAMVVAAGLGDVIDVPSVMHKARSRGAAVAATCISFLGVLPLLLIVGALLAAQTSHASALQALSAGPAAWRWGVCALAIGSACLGNAGLIYSGALSAGAAWNTPADARLRAAVAVCAVALALSPIAARLERLLDFLGIATGAVGAGVLALYARDGFVRVHRRPVAECRARARLAMGAVAAGFVAFVWAAQSAPAWSVGVAVVLGATGQLLWPAHPTRAPGA